MRIGILRFNQTENDRPWLFTSKPKAKLLVDHGTHKWLSKCIIHELTEYSTPESSPSRHFQPRCTIIPKLLPPLATENNFCLTYPVKDESSQAEYNFERVWGALSMPSTISYQRDSKDWFPVELSSGGTHVKTMKWRI